MIQPPRNKAERRRLYGQPIQAHGDLRLTDLEIRGWWPDGLPLSWDFEQHANSIRCHRVVVEPLTAVFDRLQLRDALWMVKSYGGCWNHRLVRGGAEQSMHSWGVAIDLNTPTNRLGEYGDMPWVVVEAFKHYGWVWGGDFSRKDFMHFQYGR